jgi:hypothetical protein
MATEIWNSCYNTLMVKGQKCGLQLINTEKQHHNHSVNLPDFLRYWVGIFRDAYSDTDKAP